MNSTTVRETEEYGQFAPSGYTVAPLGDSYVRFFGGFRVEPSRH